MFCEIGISSFQHALSKFSLQCVLYVCFKMAMLRGAAAGRNAVLRRRAARVGQLRGVRVPRVCVRSARGVGP